MLFRSWSKFSKWIATMGVGLGSLMQLALAQTSCPQIAIPSYFYPGALWDQAISGAPKVGILIINPDSGPGAAVDPNYVSTVTKGKAAGIRMLGYVYTSYGNRSATEVKADIDKYKNWYQVDGIFLDEVSDQAGLLPYYRDIANHVRSTQGSLVMLNPGVYPDEAYASVGDILVVFEDAYSTYLNATAPSWVFRYPASKFLHLVYAAPDTTALNQSITLAGQRNAGYVYVTSDNLPNPWDELPSYWSSELGLACSLPTAPSGPTTPPTPSDTQPPVVTITAPAPSTRVNPGTNVEISATASDNAGVSRVEFYVGSQLRCTDNTAPYTCNWTVPTLRGVSFTLRATAYDAAGNAANSPEVRVSSFVVTTPSPTPLPTLPPAPSPTPSPVATPPPSGGGSGRPPACGTGTVWRVDDTNGGTKGVWVQQQGGAGVYSGRWTNGVTGTLRVSTQGGNIAFQRTDDPSVSQVTNCLYEGTFGADGTSASGTVTCNSGTSRLGPFNWSAQVSCEDPRRGFEVSIDRPGRDYRNLEIKADPVECWSQCQLESQCVAWTYVNPGIQGPSARCWLKNSVPAQVPNVGFATSGVKNPFGARR